MKKTLAAVAVLGAFAGSALAADVQLYGIVDTGVRYLSGDYDKANTDSFNKFSMESSMASGSRFGFKGTEDLGNGLTVGFILENQFNSDDGSLKDDDHFFRREASLFLEGSFGKFAMGRMGSINGGTSSWAQHGVMSAFGTSWGSYAANADNVFGNSQIWDNMIAYQTPSFAGFKVYAQYGMGNQVTKFDETVGGVENESSSDRYYAIGASYANGPLNLFLSVDSVNYASYDSTATPKVTDPDDSLTVRFGGNFDFEVAKVFAGVSYFDEAKLSNYSGISSDAGVGYKGLKLEGWSLGLSTSIPVAGGQVLFGAAYMDAEAADSAAQTVDKDLELSRWIVSAGYDYPFSKRTDVYAVATYNQDSLENASKYEGKDADPYVFGVMVGLRHRF